MLIACLLVIIPFGFYETIAFAVVGNGLHRPPTFLGILATVQGVGAIAGGLTAGARAEAHERRGALRIWLRPLHDVLDPAHRADDSHGDHRRRDRRRIPAVDPRRALHAHTTSNADRDSGARVLGVRHADRRAADDVDRVAAPGSIALVDYRLLLGVAAVMSARVRGVPADSQGAVAAAARSILRGARRILRTSRAAEAVTLPIA